MPATKGYRKKTRKLLSKSRARRGLSQYMIDYNIGEKVHININPINVITAPHKRYQGMTGVIVGKRGKAYIVEVKLGSKIKKIITTKEHLMKQEGFNQPNINLTSSQGQAK
ncbi:MAG: 50S ribosomal protein L21e [Thermoproteota archaeon]|jgi:large subunit ribosomal protein L21e|nr:50S ribosomal protein L21e [Thermoproteota archaeon]